MIIGYVFSGSSSNGGLFFGESDAAEIICSNCGTCNDYGYAPRSLNINKSQMYDISFTDDLRRVFSDRFVAFAKSNLGSDEQFKIIQTAHGSLNYMFPSRIVEFDSIRRKTQFVNKCDLCGGFESIVGAHPTFLLSEKPIGPGFFRTDIAFASGKSKFPLFIVGVEWKKLLEKEKFRGLVFKPIEG
ncbi:hypothetical protein [Arenicella xantha]|uniref:Uncharacterized protein n=1 Tax=Arenicella xantha TaxID=644221 RepID=A0A395JGC1_9GAMM|nr:hypothetical protein [Arenicella xantha]RBP48516.1 hypothetical protein DFR28_1061 [Arenicella xantha]